MFFSIFLFLKLYVRWFYFRHQSSKLNLIFSIYKMQTLQILLTNVIRIIVSPTPIHPKTISQLAELGAHVMFLARATLPAMTEGTVIKKTTNRTIIMIAARWKAVRFSLNLGGTFPTLIGGLGLSLSTLVSEWESSLFTWIVGLRSTCNGCLLKQAVKYRVPILSSSLTHICYNKKPKSFS